MMKVLFVDDEGEASVGPAVDELANEIHGIETEIKSFEESTAALTSFQPDVVVLDLRKKSDSGVDQNPGLAIRDEIWNTRFCPIIWYTANKAALEGTPEHPLIKVVPKGSGSDVEVAAGVKEMQPYVLAIRSLTEEIDRSTREALRDTSLSVFRIVAEPDRRNVLLRSVRRRVAARMDYPPFGDTEEKLQPWEHFLQPPLGKHLNTGDILLLDGENPSIPSSFVVVLTPSCDLVSEAGRKPKVEEVLVAQCCPVERLIPDVGLEVGKTGAGKVRERLLPYLRQGSMPTSIPIPALQGHFPSMAADLKRLKLLPLDMDSGAALKYSRVAGMDNPFREMVAWAYASTAGRPGLPDRNFEVWADEIVEIACPPAAQAPKLAQKAPTRPTTVERSDSSDESPRAAAVPSFERNTVALPPEMVEGAKKNNESC